MPTPEEHPSVIDVIRTALNTYPTEHSVYDRLVVCDLEAPVNFFKSVDIDIKDDKGRTLAEIYKFDPEYELELNYRLAFRSFTLADGREVKWAIFARVEKGTAPGFVTSICKELSSELKKQKSSQRQSHFVKVMVIDYLEKIAKDFNYPRRDPKTKKFNVCRFGAMTTRTKDFPFPMTSDEFDLVERAEKQGVSPSKLMEEPTCSTSTKDVSSTLKKSPIKKKVKRLSPAAAPKKTYKPVVSIVKKTKATPKKPSTVEETAKAKAVKEKSPAKPTPVTRKSDRANRGQNPLVKKVLASKKTAAAKTPAKVKKGMKPFAWLPDGGKNLPPSFFKRAADDECPSEPQSEDEFVEEVPRSPEQQEPDDEVMSEAEAGPSSQALMPPPTSRAVEAATVSDASKKRQGDEKASSRKNVGAPPTLALRGEYLLTSSTAKDNTGHVSPSISPVTPAEPNLDVATAINNLREGLSTDLINAISNFVDNELPNVIKRILADKIVGKEKGAVDGQALMRATVAKHEKKLDVIIRKLDLLTNQQGKLDDKVKLLGETAAERRAAAVSLIEQVVPFKKVGKAFDVFFASSLCRKYLLFYLQPVLECLDEGNLMYSIAHATITHVLAPIASGHCAFGDTTNGVRKMHYYKRAMPKPFDGWVLGSVVQYVRKTYNIRGSTVKENYLSCKGGMQNKFQNDRAKIIRVALDNTATAADTRDKLYELDMAYREDMLHAIPESLHVMTREEYDEHINKLKPVERRIEVEERGARPVAKQYSDDIEVIFKDVATGAAEEVTELDVFKMIRILEVITKERNKFTESSFVTDIGQRYEELLSSGQLDIREAMTRFNVASEELVGDDGLPLNMPNINPEEEDSYELADPMEMESDNEQVEAGTATTSVATKRKAEVKKKPAVKRRRIATSARSQRRNEKRNRIIKPTEKSSSVDEEQDAQKFTKAMQKVLEMRKKKRPPTTEVVHEPSDNEDDETPENDEEVNEEETDEGEEGGEEESAEEAEEEEEETEAEEEEEEETDTENADNPPSDE